MLVIVVVLLALLVFVFAWVGMRVSRADSLSLLVMQGTTFTEALANSSRNAIASESFYDHLVHRRFSEIVANLSDIPLDGKADESLQQIAQRHDLRAAFICDLDGSTIVSTPNNGEYGSLPDFVIEEIRALADDPESYYVLLFYQGGDVGQADHYYLRLANTLDRVFVVVADALYYAEGLSQTQIGYLVQSMAREAGVEYIIYQSTDGIIFASRATGQLLAIESDPFLAAALEGDTIVHRQYRFQDRDVLELVRPFATDEYPFGLFRIGLSLDGFYAVSRGFDRLMAVLAIAMFGLLLFGLLYFNSRQKRRQISRELRDIKSSTDVIFDQMRTGVAALSPDGTIVIANRAFEKILGVRDVLGRLWDEVVTIPELHLGEVGEWQRFSEEREIVTGADGRSKTLLVAASEVALGEKSPSGLVVVVYDITRLKEIEQASAQRERLSEMGELAAGVAHEIRNPLNAIAIAAQRLAKEFIPDSNQDEYQAFTGEIRKEAQRLNDIITRFLALAQTGREVLSEVVLSEFFEEFGRLLKIEAGELNIRLEIEVQPHLAVRANSDRLRELFTNLFGNAKEALVRRSDGQVRISVQRVDIGVEIRFSDNGPGIELDQRDKIFTPYFTTKDGGTGLGLPTVHRIVSDFGGTITVGASESSGAEFIIRIPS